ncbi:tail protein [Arthrobacter phage Persistence]|uniref:Tail protein n=1 Tax=Arthrobacter phage Persistence TaxID=2836007 RepID=A0A8F3IM08_9CAUD|nr:tail protein [Arthrobacter phage Persistence]QWY79659.1 hypothetical protein SEA_PERSISTENCE_29 [Arthrobacter phage Persistence]
MTVVRVLIQKPADGGTVPAAGELRWQPTRRRVVPADGLSPAAIVLPEPIPPVALVAGAADVDVEPSTGDWVWQVIEAFDGARPKRRYLAVPDVSSVDYADLAEVDPATLNPSPSLEPAWAAPLAEVAAGTVTPDPDHPGFYLIGA